MRTRTYLLPKCEVRYIYTKSGEERAWDMTPWGGLEVVWLAPRCVPRYQLVDKPRSRQDMALL